MEYFSIGSFLLALFSFIYALYQRRRVTTLNRYRIQSLRSALKCCTNVMAETYRLNTRLEKYGIANTEAISKLRGAHVGSTTLIGLYFQELSVLDKPWNGKKLEYYVKVGLITSEWMWDQAAQFLEGSEEILKPDLPKNTPDPIDGYDEHAPAL